MTINSEGLGPWIKRRRDDLGITQDDLADMVGAPRAYISQIETGTKKWPRSYIDKLATALKVPVVALEMAAGRTRPNVTPAEQIMDLLRELATPDELRIITAIFARAAEVTPGQRQGERQRMRKIIDEMQSSGNFVVDDFLDADRLRFVLPLSSDGTGDFIYQAEFEPRDALVDDSQEKVGIEPDG